MPSLLQFFNQLESLFWGYIGFTLISIVGIALTVKTRFFQIRIFPKIIKTFFRFLFEKNSDSQGIHPLRVFFASVGGMIGVGNIVGIVTAVQFGGPGALFWVWMAAIVGSIIKYSEIYLGLKYRIKNEQGSYDGGPMYFLARAFSSKKIPLIVAFLLCIYGVEIYQFSVIADSLTANFHLNRYVVIFSLLILVLYAIRGGIQRIGKICSLIMPIFMLLYLSMGLFVLIQEFSQIPDLLKTVIKSAFTGHAAIGGFAGSSVLMAIQQGLSRAAYSSDIGIGYDSIIQSESRTAHPEKQARLAILGVFIDNTICTMSIIIALTSNLWYQPSTIAGSFLVQEALGRYFPMMSLFMPIFLFIVGYSTIISYFSVGMKCARFLSVKYGEKVYLFYGVFAWILFSFLDQTHALSVMSLAGAMLLMINLFGIYKLRQEVLFFEEDLTPKPEKSLDPSL